MNTKAKFLNKILAKKNYQEGHLHQIDFIHKTYMMLRKLDVYIQKNKISPTLIILYKNDII